MGVGTGEMAQMHMAAHTSCNSSSRDLMPSSGLCGHQERKWCIDIHAGKTPVHALKKSVCVCVGNIKETLKIESCGKNQKEPRERRCM